MSEKIVAGVIWVNTDRLSGWPMSSRSMSFLGTGTFQKKSFWAY